MNSESLSYSSGMVIVLTYFICFLYPRFAKRLNFLASANARSAHTEPTPTGAGIVFSFFSFIFFWLCISLGDGNPSVILAFLASMFVGVIGFIDDIYELSVKVRLPLYALAAIWCVGWVGLPNLGLFAFDSYLTIFGGFVAIIFLLWIQNLFNFMDGIDGIVASEVIFVSFSAWFFFETKTSYEALICLLIGSLALGFLFLNWPPAKLFMGDSGANFLGLTIGFLALSSEELSVWVWLVLISQFLADGTLTLFIRLLVGDNISQAHSRHAYQHRNRRFGTQNTLLYSILINICWIFPMAIVVERLPEYGVVLLILASIPILLADFLSGAGNDTARIKWLKA